MAEPFGAKGTSAAQGISAAQVNHLPIVAHFARRLGLVQIVNSLVPTQMEVEARLTWTCPARTPNAPARAFDRHRALALRVSARKAGRSLAAMRGASGVADQSIQDPA